VLKLERATATDLVVLVGPTGHVVRGKVVNGAGAPVGNVSLRMHCLPDPRDISPEECASVALVSRCNRRATTDPDGAYEFHGVPPGRVIVVAFRRGKPGQSGGNCAASGQHPDTGSELH